MRSLTLFADTVALGVVGGLFLFYAGKGLPGAWSFGGLAALLAVNLLVLTSSSSNNPVERK